VVGFAWSNDPESNVGGSAATGSSSHAEQVKGDDPDKNYTLVFQVEGWAWGRQLHHPLKCIPIEKLLKKKKLRSTNNCNVKRRRQKANVILEIQHF
jgi:hypothetical protein